MLTAVTSPPCPSCREQATYMLEGGAVQAWASGLHVQVAFPQLPAEDRERLITGYCGTCWDHLVGEEPDA